LVLMLLCRCAAMGRVNAAVATMPPPMPAAVAEPPPSQQSGEVILRHETGVRIDFEEGNVVATATLPTATATLATAATATTLPAVEEQPPSADDEWDALGFVATSPAPEPEPALVPEPEPERDSGFVHM
jgi:hypothetical protein